MVFKTLDMGVGESDLWVTGNKWDKPFGYPNHGWESGAGMRRSGNSADSLRWGDGAAGPGSQRQIKFIGQGTGKEETKENPGDLERVCLGVLLGTEQSVLWGTYWEPGKEARRSRGNRAQPSQDQTGNRDPQGIGHKGDLASVLVFLSLIIVWANKSSKKDPKVSNCF